MSRKVPREISEKGQSTWGLSLKYSSNNSFSSSSIIYIILIAILITCTQAQTNCNTSDGSCTSCFNTTWCTTCPSNYYVKTLNTTHRICGICSTRCSTCVDSISCETCASPYSVLNTATKVCQCAAGTGRYSNTSGVYCLACLNTSCANCAQSYSGCGCAVGYGLNSGTCTACSVAHCAYCNSIYTTCTACATGYGLSSNACVACSVTSCAQCPTNYQKCYLCSDGSKPTANVCTVSTCSSANCATCVNGSTTLCSVCNTGYGLNSSTLCQVCSVTNCATCPSLYSTCVTCSSGYTLSSNVCVVTCSISYCTTCTSASVCSVCDTGYGLNSSNGCTICSVSNCATCPSWYSTCATCNSGYTLSSNTCVGSCASANCDTCVNGSSTLCATCSTGYGLNTSTLCQACSVSNCATCPSLYSTCVSCVTNYTLSSNVCSPVCATNCATCSTPLYCTLCNIQYMVNAGTCYACAVSSCKYCNTSLSTCQQCISGYTLANSTSCTITCPSVYCSICTNTTYCTVCVDGSGIDSSHSCSVCDIPTSNCAQCQSSFTVCQSCDTGYTLYMGACYQPCTSISNCVLCPSEICVDCASGYALDSGVCTACSDPYCSVCSPSYNACTSCMDGYGFDSTSKCVLCQDANCALCPTLYTLCTECSNSTLTYGLDISHHVCVTCTQTYCSDCHAQYQYCGQCISPYTINTSSYTCYTCLTSIPTCDVCLNGTYCSTCMQGAGLTTTGTCSTCISYCLQCYASFSVCQKCASGYGFTTNAQTNCQQCAGTHCSQCYAYFNTCQVCADGYYLLSSVCTACTSHCLLCNSTTCTQCSTGYGVDQSIGTCATCSQSMCAQCPYSIDRCIYCNGRYGPNASQVCVSCNQSSCLSCPYSYTLCQSCNSSGYYLDNSTGTCIRCADAHCVTCLTSYTVCTVCQTQYGIQIIFNTCVYCLSAISNCLQCASATVCILCNTGYLLVNGACVACSDSNCASCPTNVSVCVDCYSPYGLNPANALCYSCLGTCLTCLTTNYTACSSCVSGYLLQAGNACTQCTNPCVTCSVNLNNCTSCLSVGYYLYNNTCVLCSSKCHVCYYDTASNQQGCTQCIDNTHDQLSMTAPTQCVQICGDSYTLQYPCDNPFSIEYDGCNDTCQVMDNFTCTVSNTDYSTVCSYTGELQMSVQQFEDVQVNCFIMKVKIFPPLYIFTKLTQNELKQSFAFTNGQIQTNSMSYMSPILSISSCYTDDISKSPIILQFSPTNTTQIPQYYASIDQNITLYVDFQSNPLVFYTQTQLKVSAFVKYLGYIVMGVGWAGLVLSWGMKRLSGLQAMIAIQYSWMTVMWMASRLYLPYREAKGIVYSVGEGIRIVNDNKGINVGAGNTNSNSGPYVQQFGLDKSYFINNFNIIYLPVLICLAAVAITALRIIVFLRKYNSFKMFEKQYTKYTKLLKYFQFSVSSLMFWNIFALQHLISTSVLHFKYGYELHTPSLCLISIILLLNLSLLICFAKCPDSFDYFRYSFQQKELALNHYLIFIPVIILSIFLLSFLPNYPYAPLTVLTPLFVYTLAYKPYKKLKENIRSASMIFIMIFWTFLKVGNQYKIIPIGASFGLLVLGMIMLMLLAIVSMVSTVYYWRYFNFILPKIQQELRNKNGISQYKGILSQLKDLEMDKKFRKNTADTVFRQVVVPDTSLVSQTNIMAQLKVNKQSGQIDRQKISMIFKWAEIEGKGKKQYKNQNHDETNDSFRMSFQTAQNTLGINFGAINLGNLNKGKNQQINNSQKQKQIRQKIRQSMMKQKIEKRPGTPKDSSKQELMESDRYHPASRKGHVGRNQQIEMKQISLETKQQMAKRAVVQENKFINMKGAQQFVDKKKKDAKPTQLKSYYMRVYEGIG